MASDLTSSIIGHDDPARSGTASAIVTVCKTCRARHVDEDGATHYGERVGEDVSRRLAEALRALDLDGRVALADVGCMAGCGRPCSVAVQAVGKAGYLFGDIVTDEEVAAIAAFAGQHIDLLPALLLDEAMHLRDHGERMRDGLCDERLTGRLLRRGSRRAVSRSSGRGSLP